MYKHIHIYTHIFVAMKFTYFSICEANALPLSQVPDPNAIFIYPTFLFSLYSSLIWSLLRSRFGPQLWYLSNCVPIKFFYSVTKVDQGRCTNFQGCFCKQHLSTAVWHSVPVAIGLYLTQFHAQKFSYLHILLLSLVLSCCAIIVLAPKEQFFFNRYSL